MSSAPDDHRKPRVKVTVSLAAPDVALIDRIRAATGTYTMSEAVRDALRSYAGAVTVGSTA